MLLDELSFLGRTDPGGGFPGFDTVAVLAMETAAETADEFAVVLEPICAGGGRRGGEKGIQFPTSDVAAVES